MDARCIFDAAFSKPRYPRSVAYRRGVLETLENRCGERATIVCPFTAGTSDADAWIAGTDEGHRLYNFNVPDGVIESHA